MQCQLLVKLFWLLQYFVTGSSSAKIKDEKGDAGGFEERKYESYLGEEGREKIK